MCEGWGQLSCCSVQQEQGQSSQGSRMAGLALCGIHVITHGSMGLGLPHRPEVQQDHRPSRGSQQRPGLDSTVALLAAQATQISVTPVTT